MPSGKFLAQWFLAISKLPVAHVRTRAATDIFPTFYGMFATHVFNAGMFLFLGRAEPSWTPITRVNYVGLLPCTPTRGCQLHKLDQSASNVAAGLVL